MMKKFLVCLMVLSMVWTVAFAEEIDLTAMSMDELYSLRQQVDDEIHSRYQPEEGMLYPGRYVIGQDIKPGVYSIAGIKAPNASGLAEENARITCTIFCDTKGQGELRLWDQVSISIGETKQIMLSEGMVFEFRDGQLAIVGLEKPFWMP